MRAIVIKENGTKKVMDYAGNVKGFLTASQNGQEIACFNGDLIDADGKRDEIKNKGIQKIHGVIGTPDEKYLLRWGKNAAGVTVMTAAEATAISRKERSDRIAKETGYSFEITKEGKHECEYKITYVATGESFKFSDRNVFDFGRVINPAQGGLIRIIDEKPHWETIKNNEWVIDRELTEVEYGAYRVAEKYGIVDSGIRM